MTSAGEGVYLDSSGLVKLVLEEAESAALRRYLSPRPRQFSCVLAGVEVVRAARRSGAVAIAQAPLVLQQLTLIPIDEGLLLDAGRLGPPTLRTLDAIHLAAALTLGMGMLRLVTYDTRMMEAATDLGFYVDSPA